MEYFSFTTFYLNTNMNKPIFINTNHLTEKQKCVLALEQALARDFGSYRIHELEKRLMKLSIVSLGEYDEWMKNRDD
jgi:hypothetical protein